MKNNQDGRYLMGDGTYADPKECAKCDDGVWRHKETGALVKLNSEGGPMTLADVTAHNEAANAAAAAPDADATDEPQAEGAAEKSDTKAG